MDDRIILDLYGNLSYRFEQYDATLSLPYKSGGKYHLAGDVVACPVVVFKKILDSTTNLFLEKRHCPPL
jgi:ssRNA-specific RNase YbeY (16S rRNA maturation enzyme)